jgi:hypothetical protein
VVLPTRNWWIAVTSNPATKEYKQVLKYASLGHTELKAPPNPIPAVD